MPLIKGRPIPPELQPLDINIYQDFLGQFLTSELVKTTQRLINNINSDWNYLQATEKIKYLDKLQDVLFNELIPKPVCQLTFARKRFAASFHIDDWTIRFSEDYFRNRLDMIFKTWLHETYHAFLNFLSLRENYSEALKVIKAPANITQLARQYPLPADQTNAKIFAQRNLLGMMDRYMTYTQKDWVELDSYYLNVEIIVEDLTELTFNKLIPGIRYFRSYQTSSDYINRRLSGIAPAIACAFN